VARPAQHRRLHRDRHPRDGYAAVGDPPDRRRV